jgi:hypothetical protein
MCWAHSLRFAVSLALLFSASFAGAGGGFLVGYLDGYNTGMKEGVVIGRTSGNPPKPLALTILPPDELVDREFPNR